MGIHWFNVVDSWLLTTELVLGKDTYLGFVLQVTDKMENSILLLSSFSPLSAIVMVLGTWFNNVDE